MFKSLLRTIPTISGNFTLACRLENIIKSNKTLYYVPISGASIIPLDKNYKLDKDINVNLVNSKYEYDIQRYFRLVNSFFYKDTYDINKNIFEEYNIDNEPHLLNDNRDKNFEFGCKRIPYAKYGFTYEFYAPIYINNKKDLPDYFEICVNTTDKINQNIKKIRIPIGVKQGSNKLYIYLNKFLTKIEDNIPAFYNFEDQKIIYNNAIDCKNGGLIHFINYNVIKNGQSQLVINDFDNSIAIGYSSNNIILSECIPLSFVFNLTDFMTSDELSYYMFNKFYITGSYIKDGCKVAMYDFDINYHYNSANTLVYDIKNNLYKQIAYNYLSNDDRSSSYHESTNTALYYENTVKYNYVKWELFTNSNYDINVNGAYSSSYNNKYGEFPISKKSVDTLYCYYDYTNNTINLPKEKDSDNPEDLNIQEYSSKYNFIMNNYYSKWFDIFPTLFTESNDSSYLTNISEYWTKVYNKISYHNGILYKNLVWYNNDKAMPIDYFSIFVDINTNNYNEIDILENNFCVDIRHIPNNQNLDIININTLYNLPKYGNKIQNYILNNNFFKKEEYDVVKKLDKSIKVYTTVVDDDNNIYIEYNNDITNANYFNDLIYKNVYIRLINIQNIKQLNITEQNKGYLNDLYYCSNQINLTDKPLVINYDNTDNEDEYLYIKKKALIYVPSYEYIDSLVQDYINTLETNILAQEPEAYTDPIPSFEEYYKNPNRLHGYSVRNQNLQTLINTEISNISNVYIFGKSLYNKKENVQQYKYIPYSNDDKAVQYNFFEPIGTNNKSSDGIYIDSYNLPKYLYDNRQYLGKNVECDEISKDSTLEQIIDIVNNWDAFTRDCYFKFKNSNMLYDFVTKMYKEENINIIRQMCPVYKNDGDVYLYPISYNKLYAVKSYIVMDNTITDTVEKYNPTIKYVSLGEFVYDYLIDILQPDIKEKLFNIYDLRNDNTKQSIGNFLIYYNYVSIYDNTDNIGFKIDYSELFKQLEITTDNKYTYVYIFGNKKLYKVNKTLYQYVMNDVQFITYKSYEHYLIYNIDLCYDDNVEFNILVNELTQGDILYPIYNSYDFEENNLFIIKDLFNNTIEIENIYEYQKKYIKLVEINRSDISLYADNLYIEYNNSQTSIEPDVNGNIIHHICIDKSGNVISDDKINDNTITYGFIKINYTFDLTTSSFNISTTSNQNRPINYISTANGQVIDITNANNIKSLFKQIYPYMKNDLLTDNYTAIKDFIIFPSYVTSKIDKKMEKINDKLTRLINTKNSFDIYLYRYFTYICPKFIKNNGFIENQQSKLYKKKSDRYFDVKVNYNNLVCEDLNIYNYNSLQYIDSVNTDGTYNIMLLPQIEYKHFNNNQIYILPFEIIIKPDDIEYVELSDLKNYDNKEKCFEYFKKYILKNAYNIHIDENTLIFLFNKYIYIIEKTISKQYISFNKKLYNIEYKLTLI